MVLILSQYILKRQFGILRYELIFHTVQIAIVAASLRLLHILYVGLGLVSVILQRFLGFAFRFLRLGQILLRLDLRDYLPNAVFRLVLKIKVGKILVILFIGDAEIRNPYALAAPSDNGGALVKELANLVFPT